MMIVSDAKAMISGMKPELIDGQFVFCTTTDTDLATKCIATAICMFQEREGVSFILSAAQAELLGFDQAVPMRQITLNVFSSLNGVGLTSAVAQALADANIPCNMVAAYHHDHVFVPNESADLAFELLMRMSANSSE